MIAVKSYRCRYLEYKKPVYAITSHVDTSRKFRESRYLTTAFHSNTGDTYNVLVAFECSKHAEWWCAQLGSEAGQTGGKRPEPVKFVLDDFSYFAGALRVPLVVVMNSQCDMETRTEEHEIFFTSRVLHEHEVYNSE
jgi:hypothetical protein